MLGYDIQGRKVLTVAMVLALSAFAFACLVSDSQESDGDSGPSEDDHYYYTDGTMTVLDRVKDTSVTHASIPAQVTVIADGAFRGCGSLVSVDFSGAVALRNIGNGAFAGCPITGLDLSACTVLDAIGNMVLGGNPGPFQGSSLESVVLPAHLSLIGDSAFRDCTALRTVAIPENSLLETVDDRAFRNSGLIEADFGNATLLRTLGDDSFSDCPALSWVVFPDPCVLDSIGHFAFFNSGLVEIDLSNTKITTLNQDVFRDCTHLQMATLNSGLETVSGGDYGGDNGAFYGCTSLKTVVVPGNSSLRSIGIHAFDSCPLVSLDLSGTRVTELSDLGIGRGAASGYTPGTLHLPAGMKVLGRDVLYGCPHKIMFGDGAAPSGLTAVSGSFINGVVPSFGGSSLGIEDSVNAGYLNSSSSGTWYQKPGSEGVYVVSVDPAPLVPGDLTLKEDTVVEVGMEVNNLNTNGHNLIISGDLRVHGTVTGLSEGSYILVESGTSLYVSGDVRGTGGVIDNAGTVTMSGDMTMTGIRLAGQLNVDGHRLTLDNVAVLGDVIASPGSEVIIGDTVTVGWNTMVLGASASSISGHVSFLPGSHVSVYSGGVFDDTTPGDNLSTSYSVNGFGFATVYTSDPGIGISVVDVLVRNTLGLGSDVPIVWTSDGNEIPDGTHVGDYGSVGTIITPELPEGGDAQPDVPQVLPPFIIDPDWDRPNVPPVIIIPTPVPQPQAPESVEEDSGSEAVTVAVAAAAVAAALVAAMVLFRKD